MASHGLFKFFIKNRRPNLNETKESIFRLQRFTFPGLLIIIFYKKAFQ